MIEADKIHKQISDQIFAVTSKQSRVIENKINEVLKTYGCFPSQIELQVYPQFTYKIKIKAAEFSFNYDFNIEVDND